MGPSNPSRRYSLDRRRKGRSQRVSTAVGFSILLLSCLCVGDAFLVDGAVSLVTIFPRKRALWSSTVSEVRRRCDHRQPPRSDQLLGWCRRNLLLSKVDDDCASSQVEGEDGDDSPTENEALLRIARLEKLVSRQEVEIRRLRKDVKNLKEIAETLGRLQQLLREAGFKDSKNSVNKKAETTADVIKRRIEREGQDVPNVPLPNRKPVVESFDDTDIFGAAPKSVIDAADAAGAAILAGLLGGKQRMLVDVRDADLSRDPETLVQFVECAILPVAAGLEGMPKKARHRVKLVFSTVSQLLQYRREMALAAPEVVALSTLGFDPVENEDNFVVLVAPAPDDDEGLRAMNELLAPTSLETAPIVQPLVVINHHMVPVTGPAAKFEVAYHLRLLSVQYMSGENAPNYFKDLEDRARSKEDIKPKRIVDLSSEVEDDAELEAAMQHAHEIGMNQGVTRAMVIRAFPNPWHVFVDTSPDTDADFEVAATFDVEPTPDDVNFAIVECLEGSEREDELVAQQMQMALEAGQLDRVSEMLGTAMELDVNADDTIRKDPESEENSSSDEDEKDDGSRNEGNNGPNFFDDFFGEEESC